MICLYLFTGILMPSKHYLTLNYQQLSGNVYIIGDVHGQFESFDMILSQLHANDTLIIVGDLIDRGEQEPDSLTSSFILDKILESSIPGSTLPKIFSVAGNHEIDFLKIINLLSTPAPLDTDSYDRLLRFIKNGGAWIFKHETDEEQTRVRLFRQYAFSSGDTQQKLRLECLRNLIFLFKTHSHYLDALLPNIMDYKRYISGLPYIIKLEDEANLKSAWIAHAELPFKDEAIDKMIRTDQDLSLAQIMHITRARPKYFSSARQPCSRVVYCGHNIIHEPGRTADYPVLPVRAASNHINLDGGAYFTYGFIMVNHTQGTVDIVGRVRPAFVPMLTYAKNEIEDHLLIFQY